MAHKPGVEFILQDGDDHHRRRLRSPLRVLKALNGTGRSRGDELRVHLCVRCVRVYALKFSRLLKHKRLSLERLMIYLMVF